ncbi:hypothetical protein SARC_10547 [Sphaeroforma arctica JP610]|uniref:Phospholipid/glycerol acyltransferase domain-containing protein n=1 Tax=Sphaeroforma arctica JP610 TaxID=667725 RepID=A0A0L0FJP2_9EUKA|nr:hypothetical protein SARC_10547 [Sphaeroforma arctica JP610]KNC76980.1 hypothetical protein SARC_10547 [Sphaeroforma arctica JP610]|eukprot:XP_014150882.1 hypothetical protein SARC_10547 [Sphaeroforma arctica JP610]
MAHKHDMDSPSSITSRLQSGLNLIFGAFMMCIISVSHTLQALLHIICEPLQLISLPLHNASRIMLLRLGWSPVFAGMRFANMRLVVTGDHDAVAMSSAQDSVYLPLMNGACKGKPPKMVMGNHQVYADTFMIGYYMHTLNQADGGMVWALWKIFRAVPLGWASWGSGHMFLGFGAERDKKTMQEKIKTFPKREYTNLCFYPEGGLITPVLLNKANTYAEKNGLPVMENVMLPRTVAFTQTVAAFKQICGQEQDIFENEVIFRREGGMQSPKSGIELTPDGDVIDITIGYPKNTPWGRGDLYNMLDLVKYHSEPVDVHMHVRKYKLSDVGSTEKDMINWLYARWVEKDELMRDFKRTGKFHGEDQVKISLSMNRVLKDLALWAPFMAVFCAVIGFGGIRFAYMASTVFYMFMVTGAAVSATMTATIIIWVSGVCAAVVAAMYGFSPLLAVPLGLIPSKVSEAK